MVTEPEDYHKLDRRNVGTFCVMAGDQDIVRINCTRNRTFFHRHRRWLKQNGKWVEARIVGYWAPDHWLCLVVWGPDNVEQIDNFYEEHAVYGRLVLHESEIADAHRSGAVIVNG